MSGTIQLGHRVRDTVTGFEGIATCRTEYLNGCIRIGVQPPVAKKGGEHPASVYFDLEQLVYVDDGVRPAPKVRPTGGARPDPQRAPDPTR